MIAQIPAYPGPAQPRARSPRLTTPVILGVSVALHAGLLAYLAVQKFSASAPEATAVQDPVTTVTLAPRDPPKADHQDVTPPPIHKPTIFEPAPLTTRPIMVDPPVHVPTQTGLIEALTIPGSRITTDPEPDPVITSPSWIRKPGPKEFARFYPDRALRMEKAGSAVLACRVTNAGAVTACQVDSEAPASYGFGDAALKLAPYFQLSPPTRDGRPIEGAGIQIPIRFSLGG